MHSCVSRVEAVSKVFSMQERVTRVFRVKTVNKELTVQKSLVGHGGGDDYPGEEGQRVLAQEEEHEGDPGVPGEEHNPDDVPGKSAQLVLYVRGAHLDGGDCGIGKDMTLLKSPINSNDHDDDPWKERAVQRIGDDPGQEGQQVLHIRGGRHPDHLDDRDEDLCDRGNGRAVQHVVRDNPCDNPGVV